MIMLITGGAGFIGSHLCERLLKGNKVICVDNLNTGSKENIRHLLGNPDFRLISHDITEPLAVEDEDIEQIYNLACPASPVHYQIDPVKTVKTNVMGAINMLEFAKKHNARILQASTSEVYGDPLEHPQKETYTGNVNCIGVRSCYDEGKRCAETLFFDYHRQNKVDIRVVRIFNTYGPRMARNDGRVVSNFALQAIEGKDITVYGDGSQTRSFCYVSDLVEGLIRMMNNQGFTGPVNIGNPKEISMIELAKKIVKIAGSKSKIAFKEKPLDDPQKRMPDISLAKQKLGWEPKVELDIGLKETIEWFRKKVSANGNQTNIRQRLG